MTKEPILISHAANESSANILNSLCFSGLLTISYGVLKYVTLTPVLKLLLILIVFVKIFKSLEAK